MKLTLRSKEVKNELLVRGLQLYGTTVSMKDEDSSITRVALHNLPANIQHDDIKVEMSKYGEVLRVEHDFIYADGYKTSAVTGTRFAYMASIATRIPTIIEIKPDENTASSVAKVMYRGKNVITQEGKNINTPGNATKSDKTCYACGSSGHISTDCPDNAGSKKNEDVYLIYSSKCPLHVMNTEYPFRINNQEYSCIEQFVSESKCLHFGDKIRAAQIRDETDPKAMRRIGERIAGYVNAEWTPHVSRILTEAVFAKYNAPEAAGAREELLATGNRVIGEATRNMRYGTGIHISDPDTADQTKWEGENLTGKLLMAVRAELIADSRAAAEQEASEEEQVTASEANNDEEDNTSIMSVAGSDIPEVNDSDAEESGSSDSDMSTAGPLSPVSPVIAEIQKLAGSPPKPPTRFVLVIGDENVLNLCDKLSGNYGENDTPHIVKCHAVGSSIQSVSKQISDKSIASDIDCDKVDTVVLHLGAQDWNTASENIPTALAVFTQYQQLLNSVCRRFQNPQIVISGVLLRYLNLATSPAEREQCDAVNTESSKLNKMLCTLGEEENVHFEGNESSIHISPLLESLYDTPTMLNEKGKLILADHLRSGISAAFAQDMLNMGLPDYIEVKKGSTSS